LAQLVHYAPHLENDILETFISAGERMYNSNEKTKIKAVRKNVMDAWNGSVNNPTNNATLDKIISDQEETKTVVEQKNTDINYSSEFRYLGEDEKLYSLILNEINKDKFTIINAPTGSGKTTLVKKLDKDIEDKIIFLAPLRTIVEQQSKEYKTVLGGANRFQVKDAEKETLLFSSYSSANKLSSVKDKVLIIDESHLLSDRSNILYKEIQTILRMIKEAKKVIFFSATTNILLKEIFKTNQINIKTPVKKQEVKPLFYKENRSDVIIKWLSKKTDDVKVLFLNNKTTISDIRKDLVRLGIHKNEEIATFTANVKDVASDDYQHLIKEQEINDNIKLVLSTSKIGEGVSITNKKNFDVLFAGSKDVHFFAQAPQRFRNAKELKVSVLFNESFKTLKGTKIDKKSTYSSLLSEVQKVPTVICDFITEEKEKTKLPNINIDWSERAIIYVNEQKCINSFEILNQIKQIEERFYNFDLWKTAVSKVIENIHFTKDVNVNQVKNKDLVQFRKDRRKEKKEFLEMIRTRLANDKAGAVLNQVKEVTKNTKLKAFVDYQKRSFTVNPKLTTDEKILFFENFETIERYINSIKTLMNILSLDFTEAGVLFNEHGNYKTDQFNLMLKQYVVAELKSKGAKTINQAKTLQSVKKIEDVFTPFLNDNEVVMSKASLFFLLRAKLDYRIKCEDIGIVKNRIGSIFDVSYNKKSKEFTLKNTVPQFILYIENKTKRGTNVSSVVEKDTDLFSVTNLLCSSEEVKHQKNDEILKLDF
jgi:energy-coupling factor transporter ATP-binding protein EcfA2